MKDQRDEITFDMIGGELGHADSGLELDNLPAEQSDDDNALELEVAAMTEQARSRLLGEFIGSYKTSSFFQKTVAAAAIHNLHLIRKSKAYKDSVFEMAPGRPISINTWDDFCRHVLGTSKSYVNEQINNLEALGHEMFDAAEKAHIPRVALRQARKLEPEQLEDLKAKVTESASDSKRVAEIFEELVASANDTQRELMDSVQSLEQQLSEERQEHEDKQLDLKQKIKIAKNQHAMELSRSWTVDVAEIRAVAAKASESIRIQMNNLYNMMAKYDELDKAELSSTEAFAAGDALAVTISALAAEAQALFHRFTEQTPWFDPANISIAPSSSFTDDERDRLLYLRHQLMHDNIAGLEASRREVASLKRGPAPKNPLPLSDSDASELRVKEDRVRNRDNNQED
ncbi:hypothetical protein I6M49_22370 [Shewanella algae]|uniref:hypothetical protein n=1 Tax=Shewanella algae TaxID=38313 RepID=UPI001AAC7CEA|nr:hypothetical protein [Shewanella algae]MBO2656192.1 hypothetical protein [Shewanella algae]